MASDSSILALAPEVIYQIGRQLPLEDLKIARSACKHINESVKPLLFSSLDVKINGQDPAVEDFPQESISEFVKELRITVTDSRLKLPWSVLTIGVDAERQKLKESFGTLLLRLQNIACIKISFSGPMTYILAVMVKTITSSKILPYFEEFHLNLPGAVFPDPTLRLRGLHGLRKINVTHDIPFSSKSDDFERSILKPLSYSFATSPELTEICITSSVPLRLSVSHLLRRIQDPSTLKVLALGAFRFDSDVNMTPYLVSLTSLSLLPVEDLGFLETAVPARFWEELRASGAQLQELLLGGLDDDSLNFLERFPGKGLEKLSVIIQSNNGHRRFYDDVLARHAATLRELWIRIKDDRPWYLDSRNAQAVSKCKNLKVLGVSFLSEPSSVMNVINQLPETLPDLDVLYLAEVDLRPGRHIVCGPRGSVRTYIRSVPKDEVMKNVVEYDFQAPSGKEFLGRIVVRFAWDDEVIIYALGDPEEKSRNQRLREGSCDDQKYFAVSGFRTIFDYVNV